MTPAHALEALRELRALERLYATIAARATTGPEWKYALVALGDRIRWARYCLSLESQMLLDAVEAVYTDERRRELLEPLAPAPAITPEVPSGARIH